MSDPTLDTICVCPDFGMGPYAWHREAGQPSHCLGGNVADAVAGMPEEWGAPPELEKEFANWIWWFENDYNKDDFDWSEFNHRGLDLAKWLKEVLGSRFNVEYCRAWEDPTHDELPWVLIE